MSRDIRFRAWDKVYEKWLPWEEIKQLLLAELLADDQYEVLEYTGRKDKKGTPIYEGDIFINRSFNERKRFEVIFHDCNFLFIRETGTRYRVDQIDLSNVEVIGHIYSSGKKRSQKVENDNIDKFRHHTKFPF